MKEVSDFPNIMYELCVKKQTNRTPAYVVFLCFTYF